MSEKKELAAEIAQLNAVERRIIERFIHLELSAQLAARQAPAIDPRAGE